MIAIYSVIIYLLMPLVGYEVYTIQNLIARIWKRYMPIEQARYFQFALPSVNLFLIGLFWPLTGKSKTYFGEAFIVKLLEKIREELRLNNRSSMILLLFGIFGFFGKRLFGSGSLSFYFFTLYLMLFTALLYIYLSPNFKNKRIYLFAILGLVIWEAVQSGMFTVLVYMGITMASFLFIGRRISLLKKVVMFSIGLLFVFSLQLSKSAFRKVTWKQNFSGSKTELLLDLMTMNIQNSGNIMDDNTFFPIYARLNQGFNVALVMKRIPAIQAFDAGESIMLTVGSAIVPRFLWEDKMKSGGVYNMEHFVGYKLRGWSTNIGPVGEAYGNFGVFGGALYMFVFGLFIRIVYLKIFSIAVRKPLVLLWIPVLFFELSYSMENDTLQALNSVIKISIFVYVIYRIFPYLFGKTQNH